MTEQEIKDAFLSIPLLIPLYEDEVSNTYPVPHIYSWKSVIGDEDKQLSLEKEIFNKFQSQPPTALYIGIPFCASKCKYCVYRVTTKHFRDNISLYLCNLDRELDLFTQNGVSFKNVKQVYVGGGTPSILEVDHIHELGSVLSKRIEINNLRSFCYELDPRTITEEKIDAMLDQNANRLSIGIQDLDDKVLLLQNRSSLSRHAHEALRLLASKKIYYNVDLIYGLPSQDVESWFKNLKYMASEYCVPEFTLYRMRIGRESNASTLDESDTFDARIRQKTLFSRASDELRELGYQRVRAFHWVREKYLKDWQVYGFAPMSDQNVSQPAGGSSQIGIGANAISHVDDILIRNVDYEYYNNSNHLSVGSFYRQYESDELARRLLHNINKSPFLIDRCDGALDSEISKLLDNGLVTDNGGVTCLTEKGLVLYDFIEEYLTYALTRFDERIRFSTPVDEGWNKDIADIIYPPIKDPSDPDRELSIVEFGAGVGALSIPVADHLAGKGIRFRWISYDRSVESLNFYSSRLKRLEDGWSESQDGTSWILKKKNAIIELRETDIEKDFVFSDNTDGFPKDVDVVFMPSFLNHISFKRDCLRFAWDRLKHKGQLVLGYPSGAWSASILGPTWNYDRNSDADAVYADFWKLWYESSRSLHEFFSRPLEDYSSLLNGEVKVIPHTLQTPSSEILFRLVVGCELSCCSTSRGSIQPSRSSYAREKQLDIFRKDARKILERLEELKADGHNIEEPFRYTWQMVEKP